jgi:hypothetical protein
MDLVSQIMTT